MYLCINCNADAVERADDSFRCKKCKYEWDVAHEVANAAYLASQGRTPAKPMSEQPVADLPENDLLSRLGITPGTPVAAETGAALDLDEKWGVGPSDEGIDDEVDVELREPAPLDAQAYRELTIVLEKQTVLELEEIAGDARIDLSDAKLKADKIARLADSGRVSLADDGESIVATLTIAEDAGLPDFTINETDED